MPGKAAVVPVRVGDRTKVSGFSLSVDAVVLEDGTVLGNRASLASFLAAREVDGNAADQWLTKFQAASDTPDAETAAAILQQAIDELPSARMALTLQGIAQRATSQRASEAVLRATIAEGIKTATVHVTECRRHLSRMP